MTTRASVRCGNEVHHIVVRRSALALEDHPDIEAERILAGLGAGLAPCVAALDGWRRGTILALPKELQPAALDAARTAHGRWRRRLPGTEPPMRVRKLVEGDAKRRLAEAIRDAGSKGRIHTFVGLGGRKRRWPEIWYGWASGDEGRCSISLRLDWCERVHQAERALIDGHFVADVVGDDLVLALRWEPRRGAPSQPRLTLARVVNDGTRLSWLPYTLRRLAFDDQHGDRVHGAGFEASGRKLVKVAGVSFRGDALQSPTVRPFSRLRLVPEPENPVDPCAVGVWDVDRQAQVGYLPRDEAAWLSPALARGETWRAVSAWEWWRVNGRRVGLRMMLVPTGQRESG